MRVIVGLWAALCVASPSCLAQPLPDRPGVTAGQRRAVSEERAAEVRAALARARVRQDAIDRHNTDLWRRWTYAVCLGCGPVPGAVRRVWTNPLRVLEGIPAALDDERARGRGIRA